MSTYSNISDILLELNNRDAANGSSQKSALALSNTSELEIKNLLKQIDTMIHHKKMRWERQRQEMDNKLQLREQELVNLKNSIEQKNSQIEHFKKLLSNMEKTSTEVMNKYEHEINTLHDQLTKLKSDYVKMQRKYKSRQQQQEGASSVKPLAQQVSINSSCSSSSNSSISLSPQPLKRPSSSAVSSTLNSAVKNRHQPPVFAPMSPKMVEGKASTGCKKVRTNLSEDKSGESLEAEVERLKKQLDEQKSREAHLSRERDKLNRLNEHYRSKNCELMKKIDELNKKGNEPEEDKLAHTDKLNAEFYKQELKKRDDYIKNIEALEKAGHIELQFYKDEVKKYKKQEASIRQELDKFKNEYQESMKRLESIENENKKIKQKSIADEEKLKTNESIRKRYEEDKERHLRELTNLRSDIITFSNQIGEKNSQIKLLQEQSNCLEKLLKEKEEQCTKANQELIVTMAHVEALRLENHFLRQSLIEKKGDEKEVLSMQKKYHHLLDMAESDNKRLKGEVVALTECIESLKSSGSQSGSRNFDLETRRINNLRVDYEKQIESLKRQHENSVKRLNNEIEKLYSEKEALMSDFERRSDNLVLFNQCEMGDGVKKKLNLTSLSNQEVFAKTNSLSEGVLSLSHQSLHSENGARKEDMKSRRVDDSLTVKYNRINDKKYGVESPPVDTEQRRRLSLSSEARMVEDLRKQKFEALLNNHIEHLRSSNASDNLKNNFV
ncbi:centrosomal of 63 kDa isoform X2 [Brachionus plicatilis]|uniref:Centrosomal of 63 kDa isoform X2 n=1 Tax=Brachionus plicatilis TaxID=10195 RepID=A0A3M7Q4S8_BRAPC|nr:centrosomal of 63 kDa isoform X2 [Brachionus plicatilis]